MSELRTTAQITPARAWLAAVRPRTLALAVGPVAVGSAVAATEGGARPGPALAALLGALLLQVGSNLANDVFDHEKGADTEERVGPPRATQQGWLTPGQVKRGMLLVFGAALAVGLYLTWVAGWPIVAVGLLSIAAAVAYTGGPWPLGYHGLGDLAVFVFFGLVAVAGTTYVQTLEVSSSALVAALPVGAIATAVLVVNNLRDVDSDRVAGKRTLAVRWGRGGARAEYAALLAIAYATPVLVWWTGLRSAWVLLPFLTLPFALGLWRSVHHHSDAATLNAVLPATARLGLAFSLLLALGWLA